MRGLTAILLAGLVGLFVTLCVQNVEPVTVTFITWTATVPLWLMAAACYLLGMFSGWGMAGFLKRSWRRVTEPQTR